MGQPTRAIALLLLGVCEALPGCSSSSSSGAVSSQDASADTDPDGTTDTGTEDSADALADDTGAPIEGGGPCNSSADCDVAHDLLCGFPTNGGCSASGVCISVFIGGCACDAGGALVCNCAGDRVSPSCCYPQGYQPFPLAPSNSCVAEGGTDGGTEASDGSRE